MSVRIWLNATGVKALEPPQAGCADLLKVGGSKLRVDRENGCQYVTLSGDVIDPSTVFVNLPRTFIRRVTYLGKYYKGFRTDALYRYKGATARTETEEHHHGHADIRVDRWQNISISAGSIRTLRQIYAKVRSGELKPEPQDEWGISQDEIARRAHEAERLAAGATTEH
ncbi:MAG TPA: hypothetical protein VG102_03405 [Candidatus Paceibacterota bacterium]|jgi:hypothetical protein|nr:hypothetical protein [Candidatus Paceibacterota bacterium]